jgi:hypothetical protein
MRAAKKKAEGGCELGFWFFCLEKLNDLFHWAFFSWSFNDWISFLSSST